MPQRIAHYVASTHWDREWYEPFQGYRIRLVSLIDELLQTLQRDPDYKCFVMDGQLIPILDFLEIRPGKRDLLNQLVRAGRLKLGPWYVAPDEWLVSGESLVRNLQMGMDGAKEFGAPASQAGFACDQFGHISQLPQIFSQLGLGMAFIWRGTHERDHAGLFNWRSPDGTTLPTYRFGHCGYSSYAFNVRLADKVDQKTTFNDTVQRLVAFTIKEAGRSDIGPILLFDGGDHMEIDPRASELIARANADLAAVGITIVHSDLDAYMTAMAPSRGTIAKTLTGELRETGREGLDTDQHWLIPGVLSSRIHLKQRNAACEDELCHWAEPFSTFASQSLGSEYPAGYSQAAWKHLLENHPHDSLCGCSIDQVHQDMIFRFDQSIGISSRMACAAMSSIAAAAAPDDLPEHAMVLTIFNSTAQPLEEPLDIDIPLPASWPTRFNEFFGFEEKLSFKLDGGNGEEIPWQLVSQRRNQDGYRRPRNKFPQPDVRHVVSITASLRVPAFGYTTVVVSPFIGPTRYSGSMAVSHRTIENERLRVAVNPNGTIDVTDRSTGKTYQQLLTFEDRADIGDGWFHGLAVNDQIFNSSATAADVSLIADGFGKATLRIAIVMNVPANFDFRQMKRSAETAELRITSDVTLRSGAEHVEVVTRVENNVLDHRLRVILPTHAAGETYLTDSSFDVIERKIALAADNDTRRELDVETRPQFTWTAFGDGARGLASISRGLPESTVIDSPERPLAITLLRAFRRAIFSNDNPGGQIQGSHQFRYAIMPFAGPPPIDRLFHLGQRSLTNHRVISHSAAELVDARSAAQRSLPPTHSFLNVAGRVVITSIQQMDGDMLVRLFNPLQSPQTAIISVPATHGQIDAITLDGRRDASVAIKGNESGAQITVPAKRICTFRIRSI